MSNLAPESVDALTHKVERLNARALVQTIVLCVAVVGVALTVLGFLSIRVADTGRELAATQARLKSAEDRLAEAGHLSNYVYDYNWYDLKSLAFRGDPAYALFSIVGNDRYSLHWGLSETTSGGFTSRGYAEYVLARLGKSHDLRALPSDRGEPRAGDIVEYGQRNSDHNYYLFFFANSGDDGFVVGMTPMGIVSLKPMFDVERIAVIRTGVTPAKCPPGAVCGAP